MVTITLPRTYPLPVNSPSRYSIVFSQFCNKLSPLFEAALFGQTCSVTSASGKGSQGLGSRGASEGVVSVDSQRISSGYSNCIGLFKIKCCWSQDYRCSHPFTISCTICGRCSSLTITISPTEIWELMSPGPLFKHVLSSSLNTLFTTISKSDWEHD